MTRKLTKLGLLIVLMMVVISVSPLYVDAASVTETPIATSPTGPVSVGILRSSYAGAIYETSAGRDFDEAWQATSSNGNATLTYGYNTFLVNEDYSWAYHSSREHSAEVKNARGAFGSSKKAATEEAKIEVRHSGTSIEYQNTWYD